MITQHKTIHERVLNILNTQRPWDFYMCCAQCHTPYAFHCGACINHLHFLRYNKLANRFLELSIALNIVRTEIQHAKGRYYFSLCQCSNCKYHRHEGNFVEE